MTPGAAVDSPSGRPGAPSCPLTVHEARIVRLDREINGPMPTGRLLTPSIQRRNLAQLVHGLTA
ncbi:hypothetical protein [Streptomyces sp. NPDC093990]|uniref:hypothetical protein n=1 Tax=Streptomyces sp. NPDC093990 TaxID=3155306 RepID=UPI0034242A6E